MTPPQTIGLVAAAVSLYVALLSHRFSRAPGWRDQRFFALIALSAAAYTALGALPDSLVIPGSHLQLCLAGLNIAAWVRFSTAFLGREPTRVEHGVVAGLVVSALLALVPGAFLTGVAKPHTLPSAELHVFDAEPTVAGLVATAVFCAILFWVLLRFAAAWRRGTPHSAVYVLGLCVLFLTAVNDVVSGAVQVGYPFLLSVGFMFPVGAVGYALTSRFVTGAQALERLSAQLETTVAERTRELSQAQEALHRAEKLGAIGQLAAGVAHEINNPAAVISANLRYLKERVEEEGALPEDGIACLDDSTTSIDRISRVVRQLLDAGRLAGASAARPRSVGLAGAVAQAARMTRTNLGERVTLVEAVPADLFAMGDEAALIQVLVNLLANAVQSVAPGRTDGHVEVSAVRRGKRIDLTVTDNGSGMSEETQRRLFEPFFSTKAFGEGTGLGLAVSRGLVVGLGGDLRFVSTLGRGSTATVELLVAAAPPPLDTATEPSTPEGRTRRVLVIDDDPEVRAALKRGLGGRYQVTLADGVKSALGTVHDDASWDLILCDLMMPDGGGPRLYETLRANDPRLASLMIFLTGGAATPEARAFLARQPQPVLYKPLDLTELARLADQLSSS